MLLKILSIIFFCILASSPSFAGEEHQGKIIPLWSDGNPDGWAADGEENWIERGDSIRRVNNINTPTLAYFAPPVHKAGKTAVIICPGGGYGFLAIDHEGWDVGVYLAEQGIHGYVLKYRLARKGTDPSRYAPALQDVQRAVSLVRSRAKKDGTKVDSICLMGLSAGGHLSSVSVAQAERSYAPTDDVDNLSYLPDFLALIYPAYLDEKDGPGLAGEVGPSPRTPPVFIAVTGDDKVATEGSIRYAAALKELKIPTDFHLYSKGGHGYGMLKAKEHPVSTWPARFVEWIRWKTGNRRPY